MAIKAVLFDLDGTLIDSSEGITKSAQYALRRFGIEEPDLGKLKKFIGPPLGESFMKYYGFSEAQAKEAVKVYRERYNVKGIYECRLYSGVKGCLERLKAEGYRIGLASSKPEISCRRILEYLGILTLFDEVTGATMDGRIAKKKEVLQESFRRWGDMPKEEMVLVGDTGFDIEGANQVGIPSIAVSFGFGEVEEMVTAGCRAVCNSMDEIPAAIAGLH